MRALLLILVISVSPVTLAGWGELLDFFSDGSDSPGGAGISQLTTPEIVDGLKAALATGTTDAITNLGRLDGFYNNARVKIPLPDSLQSVARALRTIKQDELAEEFELTINRAAEEAVPEAADLFADAIKQMSFADAKGILQGEDTAATEYLRKTSGDKITRRFLPIVADATDKVGVTARFKSMMNELGPLANWIETDAVDLDQYITDKAVDGLFLKIADEEQRIRQDPAARTSEILKKVFRQN